MTALLTLILAANPHLPQAAEMATQTVPERVAAKALAGQFGTLSEWQATGYRLLLTGTPEKRIAWLTFYSQYEPGCGARTASGRRVEEGRTCAMLGAPFGAYVLVDLPSGMTLRQVWDRGSRRNLPRARAKGAETWVDIYRNARSRKALNRTFVRAIWVAR